MNHNYLSYVGDGVAAVVASATVLGWLPPVAALFTVLWTSIQISESRRAKQFIEFVAKRFRKEGPGA
jgi:hypothetical protein